MSKGTLLQLNAQENMSPSGRLRPGGTFFADG
jgi:hypothetical protein